MWAQTRKRNDECKKLPTFWLSAFLSNLASVGTVSLKKNGWSRTVTPKIRSLWIFMNDNSFRKLVMLTVGKLFELIFNRKFFQDTIWLHVCKIKLHSVNQHLVFQFQDKNFAANLLYENHETALGALTFQFFKLVDWWALPKMSSKQTRIWTTLA